MRSLERSPILAGMVWAMALLAVAGAAAGDELLIGAATTSITPDQPVALDGQFSTRISRGVENPVTATAVAIEARREGRGVDQAVLVSCDLTGIRPPLVTALRERLRQKLPEVDGRKVILTATHTHTAPVTEEGKYTIPKEGVMQPSEYVAFLVDRLEALIGAAWKQRKPGGVSWAQGQAVVGHNRRAVYADGHAQMYGATSKPDFRGIEGGEDHAVEMLFFWNQARQPLAVAVNVACPSQEVESGSKINADFWHDVRQQLQTGPHKDLLVLGWPGAAGDQSPHRLYRKAAEARMAKLRGLTYTEEIARRIVREVDGVFELALGDVRTDVPFGHTVEEIELPMRLVTDKEAAEAQAQIDALTKKNDPSRRRAWYQRAVDRYHEQAKVKNPTFPMELHVLRIGDVAIATNPFELFVDYGVQIKARSKAVQTFVLQLTGGSGGYLPTQRAVQGGGYSAVVQSSRVGPEGGQVLVDRTVAAIDAFWETRSK